MLEPVEKKFGHFLIKLACNYHIPQHVQHLLQRNKNLSLLKNLYKTHTHTHQKNPKKPTNKQTNKRKTQYRYLYCNFISNNPKLEIVKISFNRQMHNSSVFCQCHMIVFNNKKEQTINKCNKMNDSPGNHVE